MDWNSFLIKAALWLLDITRGIAVIAFGVILYMVVVDGAVPSLNLPLGSDYDFLQNLEPIEVPESLKESFEEISIHSSGYTLEIGLKGNKKVLYVLSIALFISLYIFFATILYRIVKSSQEKNFFLVKNVQRLRILGFSLIGIDIFFRLIAFFTRQFFDKWLDSGGIHFSGNVNFIPDIFNNWIFLGLLVLILAQAFDHGLKIKEEQELTI